MVYYLYSTDPQVKCAAHTREVAHNNIVYGFKIVEK